GQAPVVPVAGDQEEALGVPVGGCAGERLVEDEEGGGEEGGDDVLGVVEVPLDAAGQLGAGDPPATAAGAQVLREEDGGEAGLAGAGGAPDGEPVRSAGPTLDGGGPGALEAGGPALAGEVAVALWDPGVGFGKAAQSGLRVVAGVAEAVFGEGGEADLLFAAAAAIPVGHFLPRTLAVIWRACSRRTSSEPARSTGLRVLKARTGGRLGSGCAARSMTTRWM